MQAEQRQLPALMVRSRQLKMSNQRVVQWTLGMRGVYSLSSVCKNRTYSSHFDEPLVGLVGP